MLPKMGTGQVLGIGNWPQEPVIAFAGDDRIAAGIWQAASGTEPTPLRLAPLPAILDVGVLGNDGFTILGDVAGDALGNSICYAGDVNGDGIDDFILGARLNDAGGSNAGAAYVIFGKLGGHGTIDLTNLTAAQGFRIVGNAANDWAGTSVAAAGDVNGDGYDDVIIGARYNDAGGSNAGAAYVIFGHGGAFAEIDLTSIPAGAGFRIQGDVADDQFGVSVASAGDMNGDGYDDVIVGAYRQASGGANAGAAYVIFGHAGAFSAVDVTGLPAATGFKLQGVAGDFAGGSVASAGDVNGDGYDDVIIGANSGNGGTGLVYIYYGKAGGFGTVNLGSIPAGAGYKLTGITAGDSVGFFVWSAGDFNNDGYDDVIIGAPSRDAGGNNSGSVYIQFGGATPFATGIELIGVAADDLTGRSVRSAGDVNGDGIDDIIFGAQLNDTGGDTRGIAYVLYGGGGAFRTINLANLSPADGFRIQGALPQDQLGTSVSAAGDINNDGFDDLLVSAPFNDAAGLNAGAAYVIYGRSNLPRPFSATIDVANLAAADGFTIMGYQGFEHLGVSVTGVGDLNGDGYDDLVLGNYRTGVVRNGTPFSETGGVTVIYGHGGGFGTINLSTMPAANGFRIVGEAAGDQAGWSLSAAGDINGDGYADFIFGSYNNGSGGAKAGAAYVIFGRAGIGTPLDLASLPASAGFKIQGDAAGDQAGVSVASAGDLNGDGYDDLIVGANSADAAFFNSGAAYVIFGHAGAFTNIDLTNIASSGGFRIKGIGSDTGWSVAKAGDFNGDGFADVLIGTVGAARTYLLFGHAGGFGEMDLATLTAAQGIKIDGAFGSWAGFSVDGAGDVNGDGYDDVIIGAPMTGSSSGGAAYVVFGRASGGASINLSTLTAAEGFKIFSNGFQTYAGRCVSSAGDVNGDGYDDILVVAPRRADIGNLGTAYVIYGKAGGFTAIDLDALPASAGFKISGLAQSTNVQAVAAAGDINGDGYDDLVVGADKSDINGSSSGAAYVIYGHPTTSVLPPTILDAGALGNRGALIIGDLPGDDAGGSLAAAGDINGDGYADFIIGAPYADGAGSDAGAAYVIFGKAGGIGTIDLSNLSAAAGFRISGEAAGDFAGWSVAAAGDINHDGFGDIIVGANRNDSGGTEAGAAYVLFGKASGFSNINLSALSASAGFKIQGDAAFDQAGLSVSAAGDVNNDGYDDIIVGAFDVTFGAAYVIFGKASGFGPVDLTGLSPTAGFTIRGDGTGMEVGRSVSAAGDVNGDGFDDIIIGAPGGTGAAYVIFGKASGFGPVNLTTLAAADGFRFSGLGGQQIGSSVAGAGDINGDGFADVLVGANGFDQAGPDAGAVFVLFGHAGTFANLQAATLSPTAGFKILGAAAGDLAGWSVSGAGDFNGDGYADILIGAHRNDGGGLNAGAAYVIFGHAGGFGTIDLSRLSADDGLKLEGQLALDNLGYSVAAAGDINHDGFADILVGAPENTFGGLGAGAAYVIYGRAITSANIVGTSGVDSLTGTRGNNALYGLAGDDRLDGGLGADSMTGGLGNDIYLVDNAGDVVIEAAGQGYDVVYSSVSYTLGAGQEIEGLVMLDYAATTALNLTGNEFANYIQGNAGANQLSGGGGADVLEGRGGNDIYIVDNAGDLVLEAAAQGYDVVYTMVGYALAAGQEVEGLVTLDVNSTLALVLTGNEFANYIIGNAGANTLSGGAGADVLEARAGDDVLDGGAGADVMTGGTGNDIYVVDDLGDIIIEVAGEGYDVAYVTTSFALTAGASLEGLVTLDYTSTAALSLTGNELANYIQGNAGANQLSGGAGADVLEGLGGNDIYVVDNVGDLVIEAAGKGYDVIYTSVSYTLAAGQEIEGLVTLDVNSTLALLLTGNEFANYIIGNAGANTLSGGGGADVLEARAGDDVLDGGAGADVMTGGTGNDIYVVDDLGDIIIEVAGEGYDVAYVTTSFALNASASIEGLVTLDYTSTAALSLTGNELANYIQGNAGANQLNGGAGADALEGLGGNDIYVVDNVGDVVIEAAGKGYDVVYTAVSYALAAGQEVEGLVTLDYSSTAALSLTGNEFGNYIQGNAGANTLNGGAGSDALEGRGGADIFVFANALGPANVDAILDFVSGTDKIALDDAIFGAGIGAPGAFNANSFVVGTQAGDADDRIIYNAATGQLFYDADGNGSGAAVLFATLNGNPALAAADFTVI